jgi:hypothetical protein
MRRNPGNAIANVRFELQDIIEEILRKHRIDPGDHRYDLRPRMPTYFDPFLGNVDRYESAGQNGDLILFVKKMGGKFIRVGQYYDLNGDHTSDPVIAMDAGSSYWFPVRIDRAVGDIVCHYIENGKRMMCPDKIEEFMSIQRMLAQKIREQGWLTAE